MSAELKHWQGRLKGNDFEEACPEAWEWEKDGGGYKNGRDFFRLHWSVRKPKPVSGEPEMPRGDIRLHVESPRYDRDPELNDIKAEVVAALLASDVRERAMEYGYGFTAGSRTSDARIKENKSTEAFRVLLDESQRKSTNRESIAVLHESLGSAVDAVLQRFAHRLDHYFSAEEHAQKM